MWGVCREGSEWVNKRMVWYSAAVATCLSDKLEGSKYSKASRKMLRQNAYSLTLKKHNDLL